MVVISSVKNVLVRLQPYHGSQILLKEFSSYPSSSSESSFGKELLRRKFQFVPSEKLENLKIPLIEHSGIEMSIIKGPDEISEAQSFMTNHFYKEAPIPLVLNLSRDCDKTRDFINKEMRMYLNSNASIKFTKSSRELVGVGFVAYWTRNKDYDILDEDLKTWHNTAAIIANASEDNSVKHLIWRDYQFQHIYNLGQKLMRLHDKNSALYFGALYLKAEVRSLDISKVLVKSYSNFYSDHNLLSYCQSNFRGFDKFLENNYGKPIIADEIKYNEQKLRLNEEKAFEMIADLDGIRFYYDAAKL